MAAKQLNELRHCGSAGTSSSEPERVMNLEQRADGWWIVGIPDSITECGPYSTKAEAEKTRRGLGEFFKRWQDPKWFGAV